MLKKIMIEYERVREEYIKDIIRDMLISYHTEAKES